MTRFVSGSYARVVVVLVLAAASFVAVAAPAVAEQAARVRSWTYQAVPPPPSEPHSEFVDVSCPTRAFCMGVGERLDGNGYLRPLAESWNGRAWRLLAQPPIPRAGGLDTVSCVDASWCTALDSRRHALRWAGGRWTAMHVDNGPRAQLRAARCATRRDCFMVGNIARTKSAARRGAFTLAAAWHWNGYRWHRVDVLDAPDDSLSAVDCGAPSSCYAVGSRRSSTAPRTRVLVTHWNGQSLAQMRLPHGTRGQLNSIDCPRAHACTATGDVPGTGANLVADLANRRWRIVHPRLGLYVALGAVSCRTARVCTAVVSEIGRSDDGVWTIAVRGRSGSFRVSRREYNGLAGVSCRPAACTVVGRSVPDNQGSGTISDRDHPVALRGAGLELAAQHVPVPRSSTDSALSSVSCVSGGFCAATTDDIGATSGSAIYVRSNRRWRLAHTGGAGEPTSVSCLSSEFCMAVGHHHSMRLHGSSWTRDPMPAPDGSDRDTVFGVSCVATNWCDAVGTTGNEALQRRALVEHWDGSAWSIVTVPSRSSHHPATLLAGVSCTSRSFCLAVGRDVSTRRPLVESWNGSRWSIVRDPGLPARADLKSVSCWTARRCMLVANSGSPLPFAAIWTGSRFRGTTIAAPRAPVHIHLSGLSCSSADACVAVGADDQHLVPLLESWNGQKWTIAHGQRTHAYQGEFLAVSCLPGGCTAVGDVYRRLVVGIAAIIR